MKTFAFKNSQKYWSTRYSFTPRNYSRLDRDMFTSHPAGSDAIYIHDPIDILLTERSLKRHVLVYLILTWLIVKGELDAG